MRKLGVAVVLPLVLVTGCGLFGDDGDDGDDVSVFSVKPGDCFVAPAEVRAELTELRKTDCAKPHAQEAYAVVAYRPADGSTPGAYPGAESLTAFAQGECGQRFGDYVGIDYVDSSLFFTYLLPSARGWEQGTDRNVVCFVTTTGGMQSGSVKGSRK